MNGKLASGLQNRLPELILQRLVSHTLPPLSEMSSRSQVLKEIVQMIKLPTTKTKDLCREHFLASG
jgi:hypothetical protein